MGQTQSRPHRLRDAFYRHRYRGEQRLRPGAYIPGGQVMSARKAAKKATRTTAKAAVKKASKNAAQVVAKPAAKKAVKKAAKRADANTAPAGTDVLARVR